MDTWMQTFAREYSHYGYPVLFLGVLLENAGVPVPGETAVLVASFLASPAGHHSFSLPLVILITTLAAMTGDNLGYWLGQRFARRRLQGGRRFLLLTPRVMQLAESYFQRYGLWTVFFGRFVAGLRVAGALAAGTAGMPWRRFFVANAAGALTWATAVSLLGYFCGHSLNLVRHYLGEAGLVLFAAIVLVIGVTYLIRHFSGILAHKPQSGEQKKPEDPSGTPGTG